MKNVLRGLFSLLIAVVLTVSSIVNISAEVPPPTYEVCNINVIKLLVDNLPDKKIPIDKSKIGEYLGTEEIRNIILKKYPNVGEVKELSGAKFYCFKIHDKEDFDKMYENPGDYDSVEKIIEQAKKKNIKSVSYASKTLKETEIPSGPLVSQDGEVAFEFDRNVDETTKKADIKSFMYTKDKDGKKGIATFPVNHFSETSILEYVWIVEDIIDTAEGLDDIGGTCAVPIGLTLPMRKYVDGSFSGEILNDIYVYPKNTLGNIVTKEKTVESENAKYVSVDNYQNVRWYLHANIMENDFENLTYLKFEDTVDSEAPPSKITVATTDDKEKPDNNFDRGFIFDNLDNIEVYVKKFNALTDSEEKRKIKIDPKYYSTEGSNKKRIVVKFKSREVDGKTVLDINNPEINGGENPIYTKDMMYDVEDNVFRRAGFNKDEKLTVFVKVSSCYSDLDGTEGNKKYESEKDFEDDKKNDATGISDKQLNKLRVNDFKLHYSHNPSIGQGANPKEAVGNKYKPRVDTGGIKFIKYSINDKAKAEGLKGAKFFVGRRSSTTYYGFGGSITSHEYDSLLNQMGKKETGTPEREYLAIKDNRKIWIEEKELNKAYETYKQRRNEAIEQEKEKSEIDKIKVEVLDGKNKGAIFYVLESGEDGLFELRGLEYSDNDIMMLKYTEIDEKPIVSQGVKIESDYWLTEISAPAGYQVDRNDIKFEVKDGSHLGEIECKKLTLEDIDEESFKNDTNLSEIINQRYAIQNVKPIIPNTGGIGRLMFILTGLCVMAGSIIVRKKRINDLGEN